MGMFCDCEDRYLKLLEAMMSFSSVQLKIAECIHDINISVSRIEKDINLESKNSDISK
jgi:hypothetical protein